jgi:hypothetical protein
VRIERIVVTGDVLRTTDGNADQLGNVRWLHGEVAPVLRAVTGLEAVIAYRRNRLENGREVVAAWYRLLGHAPSAAAWAATYGETSPPAALIEALRPDYERALVVGFELSPLLRAVLDRLDVPWVDIEVSPVRFLDDLALALRVSWPIGAIAHPGLVRARQIAAAAARLRASHRRDPAAAACRGACIFLAQTPVDRTLIKGGRLFSDTAVVDGVARALGGRRLVLKPHPLAPHHPLLATLQQRFRARITEGNVYALLAEAREAQFLTISSSAAIEAGHFGQPAAMLHPGAHAAPARLQSLWAHRCAAFWRTVLAPVAPVLPVLPVEAGVSIEAGPARNRLRRSLGAWGFQRDTRG